MSEHVAAEVHAHYYIEIFWGVGGAEAFGGNPPPTG